VTVLIIGGCLCLLAGIYLSCRPDATGNEQRDFFATHDPERARRARIQRVALNADAREARGCTDADIALWDAEIVERHCAELETDAGDTGDGGVTP
jgi:hypothetical protein